MPSDLIKFRGAVYRLADAQTSRKILIQEAEDMLVRVAHELDKIGVMPVTINLAPTIDSDVREDGKGWATASQAFKLSSEQHVGRDIELIDKIKDALDAAGFDTLQRQKRYGPAIYPTVRMVFGVDRRKDRLVDISVEPAGARDHFGRAVPIIYVVTDVHG